MFNIRNSGIRLHALKDESFLRTSLQRQAARLQHAAVVYAVCLLCGSLQVHREPNCG